MTECTQHGRETHSTGLFLESLVVVWFAFSLLLCLDILQVPTCSCPLVTLKTTVDTLPCYHPFRRQENSWPICESFQRHPDSKVYIKDNDMASVWQNLLIFPNVRASHVARFDQGDWVFQTYVQIQYNLAIFNAGAYKDKFELSESIRVVLKSCLLRC